MKNKKFNIKKQQVLLELEDKLGTNYNFIVLSNSGLEAEETNKLRREAYNKSVVVKHIPNRLLRVFLDQKHIPNKADELKGQNLLILSNSFADCIGFLNSLPANLQKKLELKYVQDKLSSLSKGSSINFIKSVNSDKDIKAKFLGVLKSPIVKFVKLLNYLGEKYATINKE